MQRLGGLCRRNTDARSRCGAEIRVRRLGARAKKHDSHAQNMVHLRADVDAVNIAVGTKWSQFLSSSQLRPVLPVFKKNYRQRGTREGKTEMFSAYSESAR